MSNTPLHPVCELFPPMNEAELSELAADIKANGLREAIWWHEGQIIDGRNRYLACKQAQVVPRFREWDQKGDMTAFVVSLNLHRRHLSESQRAIIAAKLASRISGRTKVADERDRKAGEQISSPAPTIAEAAKLFQVGRGTVVTAKSVLAKAIPEVVAAVESGEIKLHAARQIIEEPKESQAALLKDRRDGVHREPKKTSSGIVSRTKKLPTRKALDALRGAIGTLVGLTSSFDHYPVKDAAPSDEEAEQWERDLAVVVSAINRFRRQLKEHVNV